jgi:hypothetical protein
MCVEVMDLIALRLVSFQGEGVEITPIIKVPVFLMCSSDRSSVIRIPSLFRRPQPSSPAR